ncbi:hypothetical protein [Frankia sp. R43]|nr:hypothetical protein [Frankia sp. R43]
MIAAFTRVARGLAAALCCLICGSISHEAEKCPHRWDFHRAGGAA